MPAPPGPAPAPSGDTPAWDAAAVRRLRAHLGVTQDELAGRLGTRQQTVSEWETGTRAPRRMARRLLQLVAEQSGYYEARPDTGPAGHTTDTPAAAPLPSNGAHPPEPAP